MKVINNFSSTILTLIHPLQMINICDFKHKCSFASITYLEHFSSITSVPFQFRQFFRSVYYKVREGNRDEEIFSSLVHSLKLLQRQANRARPNSGAWNYTRVSHVHSRSPSTGIIFHCFSGHISRELVLQ